MSPPVRVRFAPSPTGYLHIGGARTALFNWLLARQSGGTYVLRMEDTDAARNTDAARDTIFRGLDWLGLTPDEGPEQGGDFGPYSQSERQDLYVTHGKKLIESGAVYPCFCSRERLSEVRADQEANKQNLRYDGLCRRLDAAEARGRIDAGEEHTWRLKVPEGRSYSIDDIVRGTVTVESKDIEDIILVRASGVPVYNMAVVVDDHLMQISHVVRGEDHLTNTFKQLLVYEAFGWEPPVFAHLPLILGPTGQGKLSKRKHPEAALEHYQTDGYPIEAFVNWLALIGWSFDDKTEIMTREELVERFSLEKVSSGGARLPMDKLTAFSGGYIRAMSDAEVANGIGPHLKSAGHDVDDAKLARITTAWKERINTFSDIVEQTAWVFGDAVEYEAKAAKNLRKEGAADILERWFGTLEDADFDNPTGMEEKARTWCGDNEVGFGKLVHPVRAAITGRTAGPGLFDCISLVGADRGRARVAAALAAVRGGELEQ